MITPYWHFNQDNWGLPYYTDVQDNFGLTLIPLLVGSSVICCWCPITDITSLSPVGSYHTGPPSPILMEIWLYVVATCWPLGVAFLLICRPQAHAPPTCCDFAGLASQQGLGSHVVVVVVVVAVSFSFASRRAGKYWGRSQGMKNHGQQQGSSLLLSRKLVY